jgi:hypothetical protein
VQFLNNNDGFMNELEPVAPNASLASSNDGGRHWTQVASSPSADNRSDGLPILPVTFVNRVRGFSGDDLSVGGPSPLFETNDGGHTWAKRNVPPPAGLDSARADYLLPTFFNAVDGVLPALFEDPVQPRLVFHTTRNGGADWTVAATLPTHRWSPPGGIHVDPVITVASRDTWLVIDWAMAPENGPPNLVTTTDAGRTWTTQAAPPGAHTYEYRLAASSGSLIWLMTRVAGNLVLFGTRDRGAHWSPINPGQ